MPDGIDLEQKRREAARWRILRAIDAGRPIAVSEEIIWRVLNDVKIPFSMREVRREMEYLADRKLLIVEGGDDADVWFGKLTREGIDVVEYTVPVEPGIARPRK